jgi:hypothetical protein
MSELSSLFVKLKINKENLERFLSAAVTTPVPDEDWTSWWDNREMYSKSPLKEIPKERKATNGEVFGAYLNIAETVSQEKREEGVYYFVSGFFSENYFEILPMLAVLKSAAQYMEPGDEGVAFIYDYFWGGEAVLAHLELHAGNAVLKHTKRTSEIDKKVVEEADQLLQDVIDAIPGQ